ncbi:hypothetical protein AgCh_025926 [Apium graveolens]
MMAPISKALKNQETHENLSLRDLSGEDFCFDDFNIEWFMGYLDLNQENSEDMNLEGSGTVIDCGDGDQCEIEGFCFDYLVGEDLCSVTKVLDEESGFDIDWFMQFLDSDQKEGPVEDSTPDNLEKRGYEAEFGGDFCFDDFDIDSFMGYLDSDQEISKKMNLERTGCEKNLEESRALTAESFVVMYSGVRDCSAADQCEIESFCYDYLGGGDLCSDDLDINWFLAYLDSEDKEEEQLKDNTMDKVVRRKIKFGDQGLDEFSGGLCLDDLSGEVPCLDEHCDLDIDWFIRCLDSDQEKEPNQDTASSKLEKRGYGAEFGGDFCCDDLGTLDMNWFVQILDSNREEPVEQRTIGKLGKRKFEAEENSNRTKKMCRY